MWVRLRRKVVVTVWEHKVICRVSTNHGTLITANSNSNMQALMYLYVSGSLCLLSLNIEAAAQGFSLDETWKRANWPRINTFRNCNFRENISKTKQFESVVLSK